MAKASILRLCWEICVIRARRKKTCASVADPGWLMKTPPFRAPVFRAICEERVGILEAPLLCFERVEEK